MTTSTKHTDADSPEAKAARKRKRAEREGVEAAQASRGPDRSAPTPERRRSEAESAELRASIADAERKVEAIHADRTRARQRAVERVNAAKSGVQRVKAATHRNVTTATEAFDRLVAACAGDDALDAAVAGWLRQLQVVDGLPSPPPADAVTRWLLGQEDSPLAAALRSSIERGYAAADGSGVGLDPRTSEELAAEREQADAELAEAQAAVAEAERAYGESSGVLNRHLRGGDGEVLRRFLAENTTTTGESR